MYVADKLLFWCIINKTITHTHVYFNSGFLLFILFFNMIFFHEAFYLIYIYFFCFVKFQRDLFQ